MKIVKWTGFKTTGATGQPVAVFGYSDMSVHVVMPGGGGTMVIEGSNIVDSPTYATLNDAGGTALSFTTDAIKQIRESVYWIRPRLSTGAGVNVDVYLLMKSTGV